ncbi:hypothetical protein MIR68_005379 [Amoeboaphelidium protococcarum]|nr:hypothetical protein MIR68_005379 [Amoeboaphelidium protococcarum]
MNLKLLVSAIYLVISFCVNNVISQPVITMTDFAGNLDPELDNEALHQLAMEMSDQSTQDHVALNEILGVDSIDQDKDKARSDDEVLQSMDQIDSAVQQGTQRIQPGNLAERAMRRRNNHANQMLQFVPMHATGSQVLVTPQQLQDASNRHVPMSTYTQNIMNQEIQYQRCLEIYHQELCEIQYLHPAIRRRGRGEPLSEMIPTLATGHVLPPQQSSHVLSNPKVGDLEHYRICNGKFYKISSRKICF